ncbi:MAG TPA: hypothetical protein VK533_12205 [Sphingomonas sp.]|uniref:hypothetical protein n=1 Tax=Sphingomonas sp. TaxID=28214 RepID=UPI002CACB5E2|nr:hypothetical protein [Sphingomonas sp.]HMI20299.1 hypothetical protein [Sphingomonas sp.]
MIGGLSSIVGDPSLDGWATFLVYLVAAWLCAANARKSATLAATGVRQVAQAQSRRRFWIVLAVLLLLLGLTRQLDLQALAAQMTRSALHQDGVYEERSGLQIGLIAVIGIFGTIGLLIALFSFRRAEASVLIALVGAALLALFTVIRTISLHDVDQLLHHDVGIPHVHVNNLIEIGTLAVIAGASFAFARRLHDEGQSARLRALAIKERRRLLGEKRRGKQS